MGNFRVIKNDSAPSNKSGPLIFSPVTLLESMPGYQPPPQFPGRVPVSTSTAGPSTTENIRIANIGDFINLGELIEQSEQLRLFDPQLAALALTLAMSRIQRARRVEQVGSFIAQLQQQQQQQPNFFSMPVGIGGYQQHEAGGPRGLDDNDDEDEEEETDEDDSLRAFTSAFAPRTIIPISIHQGSSRPQSNESETGIFRIVRQRRALSDATQQQQQQQQQDVSQLATLVNDHDNDNTSNYRLSTAPASRDQAETILAGSSPTPRQLARTNRVSMTPSSNTQSPMQRHAPTGPSTMRYSEQQMNR